MTSASAVRAFSISVTPGWWELPLEPSTRDDEIGALIAERRTDAAPELQREIVRILSGAAAVAHDTGAQMCLEYAAINDEGGLRIASLLVAEAGDDLSRADLEVLAQGIAGQGFPGPADPRPAECSVVTLAQAGPAIRVRFNPRPPGCERPGSEPTAVGPNSLRVQFFIPIPGAGTTAVVTFSSPVLPGQEPHDELVGLFDAMAETFSFLDEEGEPIPPGT